LCADRHRTAGTQVDVDLALEDNASRVSRQQARLVLRAPGRHTLTNTGRRALTVNNRRARPGVPTPQAQAVSRIARFFMSVDYVVPLAGVLSSGECLACWDRVGRFLPTGAAITQEREGPALG